MREWTRVAPKNCEKLSNQSYTVKKLWTDPQKPFNHWGLYFLHFPSFFLQFSSHAKCSPLSQFSPIFLYFINKNVNYCLFTFYNFHSHKLITSDTHHYVFPNIQLGIHVPWSWSYFYVYEKSIRSCYKYKFIKKICIHIVEYSIVKITSNI